MNGPRQKGQDLLMDSLEERLWGSNNCGNLNGI